MRLSYLLLGAAMLGVVGFPLARAENVVRRSVYRIVYFEAAAPEVAATVPLPRGFTAAKRKEPGNAGFAAFQEIGRRSRFAILKAWHDKAAADAHEALATTTARHDKPAPMLVGPFEIRSFAWFSTTAAASGHGNASAVYVLTHVDVFPSGKEKTAALVAALAEAGRKMPGNLAVRRAAGRRPSEPLQPR
jgi:quinol monooxygenase YgiN